ncbi:hypothetical protein OG203_10980 [Nocardia sp. NBC_01499]|uniref:hypothetical protein n=1 Tax=Nocardia sp. NBC_01499 TaxID=2903597 RepID=UPI003864ACDC
MNADAARIPESLLLAIGTVAVASADLEHVLRHFVAGLAGITAYDGGSLLLEGQSADWLIGNGKMLVSDDAMSRSDPRGPALRELFERAEQLKNARNTVIHGRWQTRCGWPPADADMCSPRSARTYDHPEFVFHVVRSRYRKYAVEQAWAVSEVDELASQMQALAQQLLDLSERGYAAVAQ